MNKAKIPSEVIKLLSSDEIIKFKELQLKIQELRTLKEGLEKTYSWYHKNKDRYLF